jgi:hypothetical protein
MVQTLNLVYYHGLLLAVVAVLVLSTLLVRMAVLAAAAHALTVQLEALKH